MLNGPATQMNGTRGGGRYLAVGLVCEIHNCDANSVIVVIEPTTSRMYAVQRRRVDVPLRYRFFGRPDKTMQALLVREADSKTVHSGRGYGNDRDRGRGRLDARPRPLRHDGPPGLSFERTRVLERCTGAS